MTLEEFVSLQRGHDLPDPQRRPGKVPILGSFGITGYHDTPKAKGPGVTVGRSGASFGIVSYSPLDYWPLNTVLYVTDFKGNDEKFVYYFLKSIDFTCFNSGSAQPSLNRNYIYSIMVKIPPLPEQRAIACILGTLDDKIEANRRMNETLEAMARAIFKSWFVDFDPVRARAEGREPAGMDAETAALFPDSFEDSLSGEIPLGWQINSIKSRASRIQYGLTQSASVDPIGPRFLRITDIKGGKVDWRQVPYCEVSKEDHEKYRIRDGDIFIARTGASTGDNIYIIDPPDSIFASYLVRFQFEDPAIARLVGEFMKTPTYFEYVAGCIGGSAQPNASAQLLADAQLVFPADKIAHEYYQLLRPFDQKCAANYRESNTLMKIRDILLPKLLSGDISIR